MLQANPLLVPVEAAEVFHPQRGRLALLFVAAVGDVVDADPFGPVVGQHPFRGGAGGDAQFRWRKFVSAFGAVANGGMVDGVALGTGFDRGLPVTLLFLGARAHLVDGPVPGDVAGEIQHQAVLLAGMQTGAASGNLHVEPGGFGGAQHGDEVHCRGVEPRGQNVHGRQRPDLPPLERLDDGVPLRLGGVAEDALTGMAPGADGVPHMLGVGDAGAEDQPRLTILAVGDDLLDGVLGDRIQIHGGFELTGDELPATGADAGDVQLCFGLFAHQGAEKLLVDEVAH
ncbi:hypothetical protein MAIT1_04553 [Magnetofaba australis IT-1]|uniref:Uncharacterized protein n=1 Tax=Magnetofaba australis IT-1 TaxID=1434232 RepID=A0A1Y2KA31_9PROT|nr:hypothetical protein MAIT1_04553 [Magnetofaba australis IT-1]